MQIEQGDKVKGSVQRVRYVPNRIVYINLVADIDLSLQ